MARIKIPLTTFDPKRMKGRQVILQVEDVNVELGEIICTVVAISGDIADGAINAEFTGEWVAPPPPKPSVRLEYKIYLPSAKDIETYGGW